MRTFAIAEQLGLGFRLEELVVRRAWHTLTKLGKGQYLSLNLTPDSLLELARRANHRPDADLSAIVVEITEHRAIEAYAELRDELARLRKRGLRVAVDDVGSGYASLRHVLELRPDIVKVDRWLIHGLAEDCARKIAVKSFVSLAHKLESVIVAEGVERREDLRAVYELGMNAAQGYLLGKPSTDPDALAGWISEAKRHPAEGEPQNVRIR
jgi:EAL domain-containing protein (putative c-di-GMP-specific phosphodiesterase class I)